MRIRDQKNLFPACITDDNEKLYYVTHVEHAIKELDLKNLKSRYIDNPENYVPTEWIGVDKLLIAQNALYLFEQNGKRLLEYSLSNKSSRCYKLKYGMFDCDNWAICVIYNNMIFAFSSFANIVTKIDLKNGRVEEKEELCSNISYVFQAEKSYTYSKDAELEIPHKLYSCGCEIDHNVWLFTERKGVVLNYELSTGNCTQYSLPRNINGCTHAMWSEGIFYILSTEGNLYSWNIIDDKTEMIFDSKGRYSYPYFGKIAVTDTNIWMLPCLGEDICIVNLKNGRNNIYSEYPKDFNYFEECERSKYFGYSDDKDKYYFAMHSANYILVIEKASGKGKWLRPIEPNLNEKIRYYKTFPIGQYEEEEFGIEGFLLLLKQRKNPLDVLKKTMNSQKVWNILK